MISQKCQYALRAVFELAKRHGTGPVSVADIAHAQAIPPRFLEVILNQLKQARFVDSRRGSDGGYFLQRRPDSLTVGEIIRFVEGPLGPVACLTGQRESCALSEECVFMPMWRKVEVAVSAIYDETTFQDLVEQEARMRMESSPSYVI